MSIAEILLLSLSLAVDCFTISIVCGAVMRAWCPFAIWRTALLFGLFQALMPLLGWGAMGLLASHVQNYGHLIAFLILAFIGGRMVWQSLRGGDSQEQKALNPFRLATQLLLAVATSIDALAVGASLAMAGHTTLPSLTVPIAAIGTASLLLSLLGHWLGIRFGRLSFGRLSPELLGGVVLIAIGCKVLAGG